MRFLSAIEWVTEILRQRNYVILGNVLRLIKHVYDKILFRGLGNNFN
jgi:hypothetical protein